MPFATNELSAASASPIELYEFVGTTTTYRLTSYAKEIINATGTYTPTTMKRSAAKNASQDQADLGIDVELPFDHPIIQDYAFGIGQPDLTLTIYRCHRDNYNDTIILWTGKPLSFTVEGRLATLRVPSLFASLLQGLLPAPRFQSPCNHFLYDPRCAIDPDDAANSYTTTVVSASLNTVVLSASSFANGQCNAGEIVSNVTGERRMIISNTGTSFTVNYPFNDLNNSDSVTVYRGCDHSFETCRVKFNNVRRFGGYPYVPPDNPFASEL